MRIGVYIPSINSTEGGAFFYIKTLIETIKNINCNHEFIFFQTDPSSLVDSLDVKTIHYNFHKAEDLLEPELKKRNWYLQYRFLSFLKNKCRISLFDFQKTQIDREIESIFEDLKKQLFVDFVKTNNIDCIYYSHPFYCFNPEIPFISTIWDLGHITQSVFPEISGNGEFEKRDLFCRTILPRSYRIIRESEVGKQEIHEFYNIPKDRIIVIPQFPSHVINLEVSKEEQFDILNNLHCKPFSFIFYPAQFWAHKNHSNLIKAFKTIKDKGYNYTLLLVGSDKNTGDFIKDKIAKYNLEETVIITGFVDDKTLYTLYKNARAMVYPSFLGPTNMPIVESIALNCPLICSDLSGHREQAGDYAIYFNPSNVNDIAKKLEFCLNQAYLNNSNNSQIEKRYSDNSSLFTDLIQTFNELESKIVV